MRERRARASRRRRSASWLGRNGSCDAHAVRRTAAFFAAYAAESGVDRDWRERAPLYNLYHLLNHLNLFGAGYLDGVRAILRRFG